MRNFFFELFSTLVSKIATEIMFVFLCCSHAQFMYGVYGDLYVWRFARFGSVCTTQKREKHP